MKAVTLYQPWATLIVDGWKTIETRNWRPPEYAIGQRIAIHAGKTLIHGIEIPLRSEIIKAYGTPWHDAMPFGMVLGTAVLKMVRQVARVEGDRAYFGISTTANSVEIDIYGDFSAGRWLWFLEDIQKFERPIPARGRHMLWEFDSNDIPAPSQALSQSGQLSFLISQ